MNETRNSEVTSQSDSGQSTGSLSRLEAEGLAGARKAFTTVFRYVVISTSGLILLSGAAMIYVALMKNSDDGALLTQAMAMRSLQITYGNVLGAVCMYLGVVMSWFGITASFALSGQGEGAVGRAKFAISSASPGIALILGGMFLSGLAMHRPISYWEEVTVGGTQLDSFRPMKRGVGDASTAQGQGGGATYHEPESANSTPQQNGGNAADDPSQTQVSRPADIETFAQLVWIMFSRHTTLTTSLLLAGSSLLFGLGFFASKGALRHRGEEHRS